MNDGTSVGFSSLYTEIAPHIAMRPFLFILLITSVDADPPTFSKKQSIPSGAHSLNASSMPIFQLIEYIR